MKMLALAKITLDPLTQPRVSLSHGTVEDYAQAYTDGEKLPEIVVFHDGDSYFLADGWHRYKAAEKMGCLEMEADVREGDLRDAILFGLSANSKHGLNRTSADKRKAVLTCFDDEEWSQLSAREIGRICGVSHELVNQMYREINGPKEPAAETTAGNIATPKEDNTAPSAVKSVSKGFDDEPADTDPVEAKAEPKAFIIPEGMVLVDAAEYEEMQGNYKDALDELAALNVICDADDKLKAAAKELTKTQKRLSVSEDRVNGLMREKNEAIRLVKARDKSVEKLQKKLEKLGVTKF